MDALPKKTQERTFTRGDFELSLRLDEVHLLIDACDVRSLTLYSTFLSNKTVEEATQHLFSSIEDLYEVLANSLENKANNNKPNGIYVKFNKKEVYIFVKVEFTVPIKRTSAFYIYLKPQGLGAPTKKIHSQIEDLEKKVRSLEKTIEENPLPKNFQEKIKKLESFLERNVSRNVFFNNPSSLSNPTPIPEKPGRRKAKTNENSEVAEIQKNPNAVFFDSKVNGRFFKFKDSDTKISRTTVEKKLPIVAWGKTSLDKNSLSTQIFEVRVEKLNPEFQVINACVGIMSNDGIRKLTNLAEHNGEGCYLYGLSNQFFWINNVKTKTEHKFGKKGDVVRVMTDFGKRKVKWVANGLEVNEGELDSEQIKESEFFPVVTLAFNKESVSIKFDNNLLPSLKMRKSCHISSLSPPQKPQNNARYSTDMADQYAQIAQFLTSIITNVNNPPETPPQKSSQFLSPCIDPNLQSIRRKSSVLRNLKSPLKVKSSQKLTIPNQNTANSRQSTPRNGKNSRKSSINSRKSSRRNSKTSQISRKNSKETGNEPSLPAPPKKIVYKRFMSSMDMETNSQELFSGKPEENSRREISTKTLKILKCLNRPEKCIKYCCYAFLSLMAGKTKSIPEEFLLIPEKEFEWMNIREHLKNLSEEIVKNKDFFKEFFDLNLDEDNLMKGKYYIGKALKKISNYKSPYREYFNEIAGFTQSSIDHFTSKRKNSRVPPKSKKRENYEETMKNSRIVEDPEEMEQHRKSTQQPKPKKDYNIIINNLDFEPMKNLDFEPRKKSSASQSPHLIKHDYNIFINNITFQEVESGKRREMSYHEKFAKLSKKKPEASSQQEEKIVRTHTEDETPKKYTIRVSPVVLEAESKKCEVVQKKASVPENVARLTKVEKIPIFVEEEKTESKEPEKIEEKGKKIEEEAINSEEILSESEDSEKSSSQYSAQKVDPCLETPGKIEECQLKSEESLKKEVISLKSDTLSKNSKTSLGNMCKKQQNSHIPGPSPFHPAFQKPKEENDMKSVFSKSQMILLTNGLISNKHNMTPVLFYLGKAMVYVFGELDENNPGLSKLAFTHETAQIRDFISSFPSRFANFDYSQFDKKIMISKENLQKAQKQLNFLIKEIRATRGKLPPYLKNMKSALERIIASQSSLRKKSKDLPSSEHTPKKLNYKGFFSEVGTLAEKPEVNPEKSAEKGLRTMRNLQFKSRSKEKKKDNNDPTNCIKPLIDLYENQSQRRNEIELLKIPRKMRFQRNSPKSIVERQKKRHVFLSPQNDTPSKIPYESIEKSEAFGVQEVAKKLNPEKGQKATNKPNLEQNYKDIDFENYKDIDFEAIGDVLERMGQVLGESLGLEERSVKHKKKKAEKLRKINEENQGEEQSPEEVFEEKKAKTPKLNKVVRRNSEKKRLKKDSIEDFDKKMEEWKKDNANLEENWEDVICIEGKNDVKIGRKLENIKSKGKKGEISRLRNRSATERVWDSQEFPSKVPQELVQQTLTPKKSENFLSSFPEESTGLYETNGDRKAFCEEKTGDLYPKKSGMVRGLCKSEEHFGNEFFRESNAWQIMGRIRVGLKKNEKVDVDFEKCSLNLEKFVNKDRNNECSFNNSHPAKQGAKCLIQEEKNDFLKKAPKLTVPQTNNCKKLSPRDYSVDLDKKSSQIGKIRKHEELKKAEKIEENSESKRGKEESLNEEVLNEPEKSQDIQPKTKDYGLALKNEIQEGFPCQEESESMNAKMVKVGKPMKKEAVSTIQKKKEIQEGFPCQEDSESMNAKMVTGGKPMKKEAVSTIQKEKNDNAHQENGREYQISHKKWEIIEFKELEGNKNVGNQILRKENAKTSSNLCGLISPKDSVRKAPLTSQINVSKRVETKESIEKKQTDKSLNEKDSARKPPAVTSQLNVSERVENNETIEKKPTDKLQDEKHSVRKAPHTIQMNVLERVENNEIIHKKPADKSLNEKDSARKPPAVTSQLNVSERVENNETIEKKPTDKLQDEKHSVRKAPKTPRLTSQMNVPARVEHNEIIEQKLAEKLLYEKHSVRETPLTSEMNVSKKVENNEIIHKKPVDKSFNEKQHLLSKTSPLTSQMNVPGRVEHNEIIEQKLAEKLLYEKHSVRERPLTSEINVSKRVENTEYIEKKPEDHELNEKDSAQEIPLTQEINEINVPERVENNEIFEKKPEDKLSYENYVSEERRDVSEEPQNKVDFEAKSKVDSEANNGELGDIELIKKGELITVPNRLHPEKLNIIKGNNDERKNQALFTQISQENTEDNLQNSLKNTVENLESTNNTNIQSKDPEIPPKMDKSCPPLNNCSQEKKTTDILNSPRREISQNQPQKRKELFVSPKGQKNPKNHQNTLQNPITKTPKKTEIAPKSLKSVKSPKSSQSPMISTPLKNSKKTPKISESMENPSNFSPEIQIPEKSFKSPKSSQNPMISTPLKNPKKAPKISQSMENSPICFQGIPEKSFKSPKSSQSPMITIPLKNSQKAPKMSRSMESPEIPEKSFKSPKSSESPLISTPLRLSKKSPQISESLENPPNFMQEITEKAENLIEEIPDKKLKLKKNETFFEERPKEKPKEMLSRSLSCRKVHTERSKDPGFFRMFAETIDEKKLWREGYFKKTFNGDPFRVYNMLKASNVLICKNLRVMRSCETQYFEEFLVERLKEEEQKKERLNRSNFEDYFKPRKSNLNFELRAQTWAQSFQKMFEDLMTQI